MVTAMHNRHLIHACLMAMLVLGVLSIVPARAGLFGETDEEKAARIHEQNQDSSIADLNQRVRDLEESLRQATGQNEALTHRLRDLDDKIERQKKDFEYRLCTLAAQQLGAAPTEGEEQTTLPCGGGTGAPMSMNAPPPGAQSSAGVIHLAPPPGVLGTLPAGTTTSFAAAPTNPDARAQFDAALNLLAKARYDEARASFRSFADANPDDALTPQAVYWVGDIAFVQKDYAGAARAFAEQIKNYPASTRGPDSMLKLGQSLLALGQTKEGCMTLAALPSKYPAASKAVVAQATGERKASCR